MAHYWWPSSFYESKSLSERLNFNWFKKSSSLVMEFKWFKKRIAFMVGKKFTKWWARLIDSYLGYRCNVFFREIIFKLYSLFWYKRIWFKKWSETSCYFNKIIQQLKRFIPIETNLPFKNYKISKLWQPCFYYLTRWPCNLPRSQEKLLNNQKIYRIKRLN